MTPYTEMTISGETIGDFFFIALVAYIVISLAVMICKLPTTKDIK